MRGPDASKIRIEGLAVGFRAGQPIARGINLDLGSGLTVIIGANGAGKSTLVRTLATVLPPLEGRVSLCGSSVVDRRGRREARRRLGYVPQQPSFPGSFSVSEFLRYGATLRRVPDVDAAISTTVERFSLADIVAQPIGRLSGGQRQRCFLAEALLHDPEVLLLDEPTAGLDIPTRHALLADLENQSGHRCVVLTTHLVEDVSLRARHVVLVERGQVREVGSGSDVAAASAASGKGLAAYLSGLFTGVSVG